jgi:hypothetical protein
MNEKAIINNFSENNEKLKELEEKLDLELNKFNPFNILKISNQEIRHSNVLSWIIDPNGHHKLEDIILKKIITHIFEDTSNKENLPSNFNFQNINRLSFADAKVYREKDNIDLLVISESNKFILLIENKIYAKESLTQLKKYLDKIKIDNPGYYILPVFLTLLGEEPKGADYCVLEHDSILKIIYDAISNDQKNKMELEVYNFIRFYLKTLGRLLFMDAPTKKICKEIYKKHQEAIKLIYSIGNELDLSNAFQNFKKNFPKSEDIKILTENPRLVWFQTDISKKIPKMKIENEYPFSFWFRGHDRTLKLGLEIDPFDEPQKRIDFLLTLEKKGIRIRESAKQPNKKYTVICSETEKIKDWEDSDELADKMIKLYNKKKMVETKQKLLVAIDEFEW